MSDDDEPTDTALPAGDILPEMVAGPTVAKALDMTWRALRRWSLLGLHGAPPLHEFGGRTPRYYVSDVRQWMAKSRVPISNLERAREDAERRRVE